MTAVLLTALSLAACGERAADSGKVSVITTIFPPYDFTREIAGDDAEISMLLPPGSESHSFEPTTRDIARVRNCDVFIYVGGESDKWADKILESFDSSKIRIITMTDCVETVEEDIAEGMEDDGGEEETAYDEHVWTSPRNAKLIVQKIADTLCQADGANAARYQRRAVGYLEKLDELDAKFRDVTDNAARKTLVFGDRFPFRYFADAYGLEYYAAFPGCSTETEASAKTVKFLIDKVKAEGVPVVFYIEFSNGKMAETIAEAAGAKTLLLHSCHNITQSDFKAGKTYYEIMSANADALREALQ